jgi:two-component system CheB/CheR fusion protein
MKRVLLIEDDPNQAEALQAVLQTTGVAIDVATSGNQGVEMAQRIVPDLVLCDIGLPDIDGDEVARRIRADPKLGSTLLFALSARALAEDHERSRLAGFDGYIVKPPALDALEKLVASEPRARR